MKKSFRYPALFVLLSLSISLHAQDTEQKSRPKARKISGIYMCGGGGFASFAPSTTSSISSSLMNNGFAPMASSAGCANYTPLHILARNVVADLDIMWQVNRNTVYNSSRTTTSGVGTRMALGYVVLQGEHLLVYPEAGLYFGSMDVHSHQGVLPVQDVSATNQCTALDFSIHIDRLSSVIADKTAFIKGTMPFGKIFSSVVGLTVGYTFCPYSSYWNDNNIDIYTKTSNNVNFLTNVVGENNNASLSMFYIKLTIGFGASWRS
jgi:hypothetical protein